MSQCNAEKRARAEVSERAATLPRFQRMDWAFKLNYNVLIFSDPTLQE